MMAALGVLNMAACNCPIQPLARPFIREPDLVRKIEAGKRGLVECVSCNICLDHEGTHGLKCWRLSNRDLAEHAWLRFTGQLH